MTSFATGVLRSNAMGLGQQEGLEDANCTVQARYEALLKIGEQESGLAVLSRPGCTAYPVNILVPV